MKQEENISYWNMRAEGAENEDLITHRDLYQKKLELELLSKYLEPSMNVLEVGCGNGFVTEFLCQRVAHVDAFDAAEEMIVKARKRLDGKNCSFFLKALPSPSDEGLKPLYDAVVSVRVIINLENQKMQHRAMEWIAGRLRPGGVFLLLEGCEDGWETLSSLREGAGLSRLDRAAYNIDLRRNWLEETAQEYFHVHECGGIGVYDFLTRFFYPLLVGEKNVQYNTEFHKAAFKAAIASPLTGDMQRYSRLMFYRLVRR
jgi:SAM-dependent methyltransferase